MVAALTVLVVDDNEANRALARATLEDEGYLVVLAEDGEAGIAAFERVGPQCVVLDIQMPKMNGVIACEKIRALPGGADVPIVFVTAQKAPAILDQALLAGGDDFLTKPFRPSELVVRVQAAVRLRGLLRERNEQRDELLRFHAQIQAANEHLVAASLRAQALADEANAARAVADLNEERFRTLVMTSSALIWQASATGQVTVDDEAWRALTGVDVGAGEWGWLDAVHPGDQERVRHAWAAAVAAGTSYECQHRIRKLEGGFAWVVARAARVPTGGADRPWIGMLNDISDRVRVEESRERFIGILGHDLRNPLNAILMAVEILDDLPAPQASVVARVGRSARRMEGMIRDVLDFARGRLGDGIPVAKTPVDMRGICEEIVAEMTQAYPGRAIRFEGAGDLRGEWDAQRVQQVLSNLIGNAVTHGSDAVHVTGSEAGDAVIVTVHNHGATIPTASIVTMFEPFTKVGHGPHQGEGLGLGLYIVSEIVRSHGGTISVVSDDRDGTTFSIRWPRRIAPRGIEAALTPLADAAAAIPTPEVFAPRRSVSRTST